MLNKALRYYETIKHLRAKQIYYRVYYKVRDIFFQPNYSNKDFAVTAKPLKFSNFPYQHAHYKGDDTFEFLNVSHKFDKKIEWNINSKEKLWQYHLNYFDFLHQEDISRDVGFNFINDFIDEASTLNSSFDAYPTSLRIINWIKFLSTARDYPHKIVSSIYHQLLLLSRKIEYHIMGNHVLENGFALLFGAVLFRDQSLYEKSKTIIESELNEQILEDGGHFELSPMYHLIILQRALDAYNLLINNEYDLSDIKSLLQEKIQVMVNWLSLIQMTNGTVPMFNDSTYGQALDASVIMNYSKELGFEPQQKKLADSGYRKMQNEIFELIADVGHIGPSYQPGHAHSDSLSFVLNYRTNPLIVDTGVSTYKDNHVRLNERGTGAHNTVKVNQLEQSDVWGAFRVGRRADTKIVDDDDYILEAYHDGYSFIGINHRRRFQLFELGLVIEDYIIGKENHMAEASFHYHPERKLVKNNATEIIIDNKLLFSIFGATLSEIESYNLAVGFNLTEKSKVIRCKFNSYLKVEINSIRN